MNIYTAKLGQFLLGWAYLPWDFDGTNGQPLPRFFDGVVMDFRSLPRVAATPATAVRTRSTARVTPGPTRSVTGWGSTTPSRAAAEPGDRVADTPAEASPAFECPVGRDTCAAPGVDPIHNFMDYTQDSCMDEFTPARRPGWGPAGAVP